MSFGNPYAMMLAAAGSELSTGAAKGSSIAFAASGLGGLTDLLKAPGNTAFQLLRPPASAILDCWTRGLLGTEVTKASLAMDGIAFSPNGQAGGKSWVWDRVRKLGETLIGIDSLASLYNANRVTDGEWSTYLQRHAIRDPNVLRWLNDLRAAPIDTRLCAALVFREIMSDDEWTYNLQRQGIIDEVFIDGFKQIAKYVPGPTELAHFMLRDAFNPAVVERFRYDEWFDLNFSGQLKQWAKWQGISDEVMKGYWRSHITLPSINAAMTMAFRLRNDPNLPIYQSFPNAKPVSLDDVRYMMRANGMAPGIIEESIATSVPIPSFRQVKNLVKYGGWKVSNVISNFRDQGFPDQTATDLGVAYYKAAKSSQLDPAQRIGRSQVKEALELGIMEPAEARSILETYGLDIDEAAVAVQSIQVEIDINVVKQSLSAVRRNYLNGTWDQGQTETQMHAMGMAQISIDRYIRMWLLSLQSGRKQLAAEQAKKAFVEGFIQLAELAQRLTNLGYSDYDATILIAFAVTEREQMVEKTIQRQQEAAAKATKAMLYGASPTKLAKWLKEGRINREQALQYMHGLGVHSPFAEIILDDAFAGNTNGIARINAAREAKLAEIQATREARLAELERQASIKSAQSEHSAALKLAEIAAKQQADEKLAIAKEVLAELKIEATEESKMEVKTGIEEQ